MSYPQRPGIGEIFSFGDERPFAAETGHFRKRPMTPLYPTEEGAYVPFMLRPDAALISAHRDIMSEISALMADPGVPIDKPYTRLSARNSGLLRRVNLITDAIMTGPAYQPPIDAAYMGDREGSQPREREKFSDAQKLAYMRFKVKGEQDQYEWRWWESQGCRPWEMGPTLQDLEETNGNDAHEWWEYEPSDSIEYSDEEVQAGRGERDKIPEPLKALHATASNGDVHDGGPGFYEHDGITLYVAPETRMCADVEFKSLERPPSRSNYPWWARMFGRRRSWTSWSDRSDVSGSEMSIRGSECLSVVFQNARRR